LEENSDAGSKAKVKLLEASATGDRYQPV